MQSILIRGRVRVVKTRILKNIIKSRQEGSLLDLLKIEQVYNMSKSKNINITRLVDFYTSDTDSLFKLK